MRKQFELTCLIHACASPPSPSQLCNKSILSCQATALWKDVLREKTGNQKSSCKCFDVRRSGTSHRRGDTPIVSPLLRCQSSRQVRNGLAEVLLTAVTSLLRLIIPLTQWSLRHFFTLSMHWFSLRVWLFAATLPPSKQNVLARGEKKNLTQDFDATFIIIIFFIFIFFRNSGIASVFCSKEQVKQMLLVKGIFLSWLLTF